MSVSASTLRAWPSRDANGRTNQKVRRKPKRGDRPGCVESREARPVEPTEFLTPRQAGERARAFRRHAAQTRVPGRRRGFIRPDGTPCYSIFAGDVLDYLLHFAVNTGRIFPSYEEIAASVGCAYRTAVQCVAQLAAGGWLEWDRRFVRVGKAGAAEPQVEQVSNFYRLKLPNVARKLVEGWRKKRAAQAPADVTDEAAASAADPDHAAAAAVAELQADLAAKRRHQHVLLKLASARTPDQVVAVLTGPSRLQERLDAIEAGIQSRGLSTAPPKRPKREFP